MFKHCDIMRKGKSKRVKWSEFTGIRMEPDLYNKAKRHAKGQHQTYSEYVRQLIVRDIEQKSASQ